MDFVYEVRFTEADLELVNRTADEAERFDTTTSAEDKLLLVAPVMRLFLRAVRNGKHISEGGA